MRLSKFLFAVGFVFISLQIQPSVAFTDEVQPIDVKGYPDPVIPLMVPLDFPWGTIEGIWEAVHDSGRVFFSFEVRGDAESRQVLRILQINPLSREVVATGTGFFDASTKQVRAAMVSNAGHSYMLFIGLYENKLDNGIPERATILTIREFESLSNELSIVIDKILPNPMKEHASGQGSL